MTKNLIIGTGLMLSLALPYLFPTYVTMFAFVWLMIALSLSWDIIGGQMGYNSFGNIFFFGIGMYVSAVVQRDMFSSGIDRFAEAASSQAVRLSQSEYFISLGAGVVLAAIICVITAVILGMAILSMRGHYFAICTLGLGIAAGEIASGIDFIGAGSGMVTPLYPDEAGSKVVFYYYYFFALSIFTMVLLSKIYKSRFGLVLNAIRDDEDKAEAMGLHTTRYKTIAWSIAAFVLGIAGAGTGNLIGFIDPIDVAFTGATFGVWMILTVILGGKGTLWGPVIGAIIFYVTKELFWVYLLGWQRVALGLLIVVIVVFFPTGILGWMRERWPHRFGERVEEAS
jgi:branched-chain amino acid transport system permease protein